MFLRGTSDECYIDMFGEQKEPVKKPKARGKVAAGDLKDQIEVNSATERTVPRSVVDQAMANPTKFAKSVRVRPYKKNGETVGFRLRRIKKGSPLELLGAKRGDVIHSVNGQPLTDVTQALGAYQAMSNESRLIFSITRKGKPMDLTINIR